MKKKLFVTGVLTLILAAFLLPTAAWAGNIFKFKGQSADAFFSSTDPSGCISTFVGVFATDGKVQSPPGPGSLSSEASLFIDQFDFCNEVSLLSAFGFAPLADQDFQVQRNLNSATLNTTIEVFDYVSGSTFNVDVDLTWTGAGDLSRGNSHSHFQSPGCQINNRFNGTFRPAEASGSVSDGLTNFTPGPSAGAGLSSVKNGEVVIGCGL